MSFQVPSSPLTLILEGSISQTKVPYQVIPTLMTADELQEFKRVIKQVIHKSSPSLSNALDSVRKLVGQGVEPVKLKIDTLALDSLRLFSKTSFEFFEDKETQSALKLLC